MENQLNQLTRAGQSIWLDNIERSMFASGELHGLTEHGLRGMTSNPSIFERAIDGGTAYDAQIASLIGVQSDPNAIFEALAIQDIRAALDEFRPLYDASDATDGFVSLEVSPLLAHDSDGTIAAAKRLWKAVDRPNLMIKIPGTHEGAKAINAVIGAGINVNVTLLFSVQSYERAANAFISGLERRAAAGGSVARVASVASLFLSRIDTAVDAQLATKIADGADEYTPLLGRAAIGVAKLTYARFGELFSSERFASLQAKGAARQRPLWASTSTKNSAYSDLHYVETIVGPHTVNTLPPKTLTALLDHGMIVAGTVATGLADVQAQFAALARSGIVLDDITAALTVEGVAGFAKSYQDMLAAIAAKQQRLTDKTSLAGLR